MSLGTNSSLLCFHWDTSTRTNVTVCVQILVVNPVFFKYVNDHWTEQHGRYPSTGMLAIIFALHVCDQVRESGAETQ